MTRLTHVQAFSAAAVFGAALLVAAAPALAQPSKPLPALAPAPKDGLTRSLAHGEITPAKYALERALSLFRPRRVSAMYGRVERPDANSATLILRDLSIRLDELSAADRQKAAALLARPTDNPNPDDINTYGRTDEQTPVCGAHVCIHYVITGKHAVSATDTSPANGIPDYVDQALQVFDVTVWGTEVTTMGYRAPKSDIKSSNNGSSSADPTGAKFDVYLANLGDDFIYGYCTSDDPHLKRSTRYDYYDMSAYCVVDNNFTEPIFSTRTPLENLEVTAAHEFFHGIQFAYDISEDRWIMEATAVWMEDELYDDIDDNLQYLPDGPLRKPRVPLDKSTTSCCHIYGDWIFFRFLSEWFGDGGGSTLDPTTTGQDQAVVREIWERLDGSKTGVDDYSIQGVKHVLSNRGKNFRKVFGKFGWSNRVSRSVYDEGADNKYPQAPLADKMTLSSSSPSRSKAPTLNHQTSRYYEFKRGSGVSSTAKLRFVLDLPSKKAGAFATALVFTNAGFRAKEFAISNTANGTFSVAFGSSVRKVDLVLTNASTRYTCWVSGSSPYACLGAPKDDGRTYKFKARLA